MPRHVEETKHFRWIRHARYDQSDAKDQTTSPASMFFIESALSDEVSDDKNSGEAGKHEGDCRHQRTWRHARQTADTMSAGAA